MPQILARDEEHAKRRQRLAKQKKGPGVFVYDGSAVDTESIPTILTLGKDTPVFDAHGVPRIDSTGRQIFDRQGTPVLVNGRPQLGGEPRVNRKPIEIFKLWGQEFPKGKAVEVDNDSLALKLRMLPFFEEVEGEKKSEEEQAMSLLGKPALLKLASSMGLDPDPAMSQGGLVKLIRAKLEADEPQNVGDPYKAMRKGELVELAESRGILIPDGASISAVRDLLRAQDESDKG